MIGETVAEQDNLMTTQSYSRLAALIFAVVSGLRLIRAVSGWPITVGATTSIPLWANWVACVIAGVLAWIGFEASR